jgi:diamine N-acetyltransferase
MPDITLREITRENFRECFALQVDDEQRTYVASNVYSLAEAAYEPVLTPLAVYDGDAMVGFVMYTSQPIEGRYWIMRVMIDRNHQHQGYGRAAMVQLIERMRAIPGCQEIVLDFEKENTQAEQLYLSLGFERIDENDHAYIARLKL